MLIVTVTNDLFDLRLNTINQTLRKAGDSCRVILVCKNRFSNECDMRKHFEKRREYSDIDMFSEPLHNIHGKNNTR